MIPESKSHAPANPIPMSSLLTTTGRPLPRDRCRVTIIANRDRVPVRRQPATGQEASSGEPRKKLMAVAFILPKYMCNMNNLPAIRCWSHPFNWPDQKKSGKKKNCNFPANTTRRDNPPRTLCDDGYRQPIDPV